MPWQTCWPRLRAAARPCEVERRKPQAPGQARGISEGTDRTDGEGHHGQAQSGPASGPGADPRSCPAPHRDRPERDRERPGRHARACGAPAVATVSAPAAALQAAPASASPQAGAGEDDPRKHPGCVRSPMVGVAYLAPEPTAGPFVSVGTRVTQGQTLLIIEAMKTMNHIPAPK